MTLVLKRRKETGIIKICSEHVVIHNNQQTFIIADCLIHKLSVTYLFHRFEINQL